jgi:hypothetical protein
MTSISGFSPPSYATAAAARAPRFGNDSAASGSDPSRNGTLPPVYESDLSPEPSETKSGGFKGLIGGLVALGVAIGTGYYFRNSAVVKTITRFLGGVKDFALGLLKKITG